MSEKKKFTVYVGSVVLCVGVAVLLHYVSFTNPYLQSICHLLRPFIYIGLYLVWAISFQKRIIQKEPRRCLIMIAVMMVFWMLVRMCKFEIPYEMPTALRYVWYLYYIPMLLLPTVSLYLAFYIRQPENYKLPERRCLLFFPALFLIGIVLTNDLHQLVFTFPEGRLGEAASYEVGVYGYGAMYYAIVAWDLGCLLAALLIILLRCRKIKNRKMLWMPFGAYGLSVVYGIAYYLNQPFWKIFSSDMTAALCLLFALIIPVRIDPFQYRIRTIICSIYNFSTDYRSEWKMHLSISGFGMYCTGNRKAGSSMSDHVRKWDQAVGKTNFGRLCVVEGKPVRITGNRKRA